MRTLRIGVLGLGQVGSGLISILSAKRSHFRKNVGVDFKIVKIAVKNKSKKRAVKVEKSLLTTDVKSILHDPSVDAVVELIGGVREARKWVIEALKQGKHVVTANKALLAEHGDEIFSLAHRLKRWVFFEASVGGGIPVIKALREGLIGNAIDSVYSIINGTCNYILTEMSEKDMDFREALSGAKASGFAEANPTLDIEGVDAAHKLAILVRFAFGGKVKFDNIYCEGISRIRREDIAFAQEFGYRIKLLAIAKKTKEGIEARVQPTLLRKSHILASVNGAFNAVLLNGDNVGNTLLYGQGAGSKPTASAVVSDLVDLAIRAETLDHRDYQMRAIAERLKIKSMSSILSRYYLRFHVVDRPGVLAKITQVLGVHQISISDVIQKERDAGNVVPLILLTHDTSERQVRAAIKSIDRLNGTRGKSQVIRIEESTE